MKRILILASFLAVALVAHASTDEFIVHEWGTFTTFSGSDGVCLPFRPDSNDLPSFVVRRSSLNDGWGEARVAETVSLETPVVYFYSDRERTVNLQVAFPRGNVTAVYPPVSQAQYGTMLWEKIKLLPKCTEEFPKESGASRYYAARETDATPLRIKVDGKAHYEKFLFYRGIGSFELPLKLQAVGDGRFVVQNTSDCTIPAYFLVRVEGKNVRFMKSDSPLEHGTQVKLKESTINSTLDALGEKMAGALIAEGLYEKEARAMVKTWSTAWFGEEGVRLLYILPTDVADLLLPLNIEPKPELTIRVMVGRHDILTPEREAEIEKWTAQLKSAAAATAGLSKLGRFAEPARQHAEKKLEH
jgi:hypothetical protein